MQRGPLKSIAEETTFITTLQARNMMTKQDTTSAKLSKEDPIYRNAEVTVECERALSETPVTIVQVIRSHYHNRQHHQHHQVCYNPRRVVTC